MVRGKQADGISAPTRRHREIASLAARELDKRGFSATTMDHIAEATGVAKATLYHYFASKDEILFLIHDEFIDHLLQSHQERIHLRLPPEYALLEVMVDIIELMDTHRGHVRVFFEHQREMPQRHREILRAKRDRYAGTVRASIEEGISAGKFRSESPELSALALFGMCNWAYTWYRDDGELRPRQIAQHLWSIFINGLVTPESRGFRAAKEHVLELGPPKDAVVQAEGSPAHD